MKKIACLTLVITILTVLTSCRNNNSNRYNGWQNAHGNSDGNKYSSLSQIDTNNVQQLQVAWEFHTGDADTTAHSQIQCNPIMVDGIIYCTSPQLKLFALDAATGKQKWVYSPFDSIPGAQRIGHFILNNNRGVAYWSDGKDDRRIFYAADSYLEAVDANTGKVIQSFGNGGKVDLHNGLEMDGVQSLFVTATSPPSIYKDLVITGTRVSEAMDAAPGDIRAYDARTGKHLWHFQYIHHDTWDKDPSSSPVLLTVTHNGKKIDAVAQTSKNGFVYLFNRETGESLFPIKETPVDTSTELVNEKMSPTQPIPQKPAPFVRQSLTEKDLNPYLSADEYQDVKNRLKTYHTGNMFMPQSKEGTIIFPGFDGGGEWGGAAVDPETGILYVNGNEM